MWLAPLLILVPAALGVALSKPFVGLVISGLLFLSLGDLYFDLLFRRLGAFVLRHLTAGRLPSKSLSPVADFLLSLLCALVGAGAVLAILVLCIRIAFSHGAA